MQNKKLLKTIMAALFASLVCVATMVIRIPIPATQGYANLGDAIVLLAAFLLGPGYGALAAAGGSALADVLAGYALYAPGTAVIKGLCALAAAVLLRQLGKRIKWAYVPAGIAGEIVMAGGYFLYESTVLGYGMAAAGSIPANAIQGAVGVLAGTALYLALRRVPEIREYFSDKSETRR